MEKPDLNTMMTGHTGYITHARKILKCQHKKSKIQHFLRLAIPEERRSTSLSKIENVEEMAEEETA